MAGLRIALIGVGKIARDQHLPALAADPGFALVATADPVAALDGVPAFASLDALIAAGPPLDAVSICTPPQGRDLLIARALRAGLHVMVEKPPTATLSALPPLAALARERRKSLFAAWHSREAGAVGPARAWLATRRVTGFTIRWHEDIRRWHPGQDWLLAAGGFGVFDPGINALSTITAILPRPVAMRRAILHVPDNRAGPIAAHCDLTSDDAAGRMSLDFLEAENSCWTITVSTDHGDLRISEGGAALEVEGTRTVFADEEYSRLYERFARLIEQGACDVDEAPSTLVADAFTVGERRPVPAFHW